MCFEVRGRDLLGRIGRLETKSGVVETPLLLPVVNPAVQLIPPGELRRDFGCRAVITNAYLVWRRFGEEAVERGVHGILGFDGVVMTDSGAYQILQYGGVDVEPDEIVRYQEMINSDIAVILDVPTGWGGRRHAVETVEETLRRARMLEETRTKADILWVGPVQGGRHVDIVEYSAREMAKLPFHIYALGSPTEVMERYQFPLLVDMVMAARMNLPPNKPLHLFGAGHPLTFPLAVAMGCDLFDSASYAIYARDGRYITPNGTTRLERLRQFPCSCPLCIRHEPAEVREWSQREREAFLARHNLHVCLSEIRRIKQAIVDGRLWEYLEARAYAHPSLVQALHRLGRYRAALERGTPISKRSALFFGSHLELARPEVVRHGARLLSRYRPPKEAKVLFLAAQTPSRPTHRSKEYRRLMGELSEKLGEEARCVHFCTYVAPLGVVPIELCGVYPASQHEAAEPDYEVTRHVAKQVYGYIRVMGYKAVFLLRGFNLLDVLVADACRRASGELGLPVKEVCTENPWGVNAAELVEKLAGLLQRLR